jgi:hypothetical protein
MTIRSTDAERFFPKHAIGCFFYFFVEVFFTLKTRMSEQIGGGCSEVKSDNIYT